VSAVSCPDCGGKGFSRGIACGPGGSRMGSFECRRCHGTCTVPAEQLQWIEDGERLRAARLNRHESTRVAAERVNVSPAFWSRVEFGEEPVPAAWLEAFA